MQTPRAERVIRRSARFVCESAFVQRSSRWLYSALLDLFYCLTEHYVCHIKDSFPPFLLSSCLPTCMESAPTISPWSRFPISIASLDFPVPVAPRTTTKAGTVARLTTRRKLPTDAAMLQLPSAQHRRGQLTEARMRSTSGEARGGFPLLGNRQLCNVNWTGSIPVDEVPDVTYSLFAAVVLLTHY